MAAERPVYISVAQYHDALKSGAMTSRHVVEAAHRLGTDGAELRRDYWQDAEREIPEARARATDLGVRIIYATHATLFNADAEGDARTHKDISDAAGLGAAQFRLFPGAIPADDDEAGWRRGAATLAFALDQGVTLALENYSGTPGGTLAEIRRALDQYPDLRTNVDIGNYTRHGEDVPAAIRAVGDRTVSAHLKDQTANPADAPVPLGDGAMPLGLILDALDALPQSVIYCFEFGGGSDPDAAIRRSVAYLQKRASRR